MTMYSITGQKHRGYDPYLPGIKAGTLVILKREPDNRYDKNAIAVWIDDKHVGYIPMAENADLAHHIDRIGGTAIEATLVRARTTAYPQIMV